MLLFALCVPKPSLGPGLCGKGVKTCHCVEQLHQAIMLAGLRFFHLGLINSRKLKQFRLAQIESICK